MTRAYKSSNVESSEGAAPPAAHASAKRKAKQTGQPLMMLAQARAILNRLAAAGITGDTLWARNPVDDHIAEYMTEAFIIEQGLSKSKLEYQIKMSTSLAPELDVAQQAQFLNEGIEGWARLIAGRQIKGWQTNISRGDALAMLFNLPAVRKSAEAALKAL